MSLIRHRNLTVQGLSYNEYVGTGYPPTDVTSQAALGDIYIDLGQPHRVFYWGGNQWNSWTSMQSCMDNLHPSSKPDRILMPTAKQFSWVPSTGLRGYSESVSKRLVTRPDNTDTHVGVFAKAHSLTIDSPRIDVQAIEPLQRA